MAAPVQPPLFLLLALAAHGNPPAQMAAVAEGAPLLAGRVLDSAIAEARSSDVVELQRCCCLALEALLEGCPRAQVRPPLTCRSTHADHAPTASS